MGAYLDDDNGSGSGSVYVFQATTLDLQAASDTGVSDADDITADNTPTFDVNATSYFRVYRDGIQISGNYETGSSYTTPVQADGTYAYTVRAVDAVGNESADIASLTVTIDTTAPAQIQQVAKLLAGDGAMNDIFGRSVSISGSTAIIGASGNDDDGENSGSAYIFEDTGSGWLQVAKLNASDGAKEDRFGSSVSISGSTAIVGAYWHNDNAPDSGSAYIFKDSGSGWTQVAELTASDGAAADYFGYSVCISGGVAIVGAVTDDDNGPNSGSAYVFEDTGSGWNQVAKLTAHDGARDDSFGFSVSISGNTAIVAAVYDDDNGPNSGSAYIFEDSGSGWAEVAKLTAGDGAVSDQFGFSVSISGSTAVVGAHWHDHNAPISGSAYVFEDSSSGWAQVAKLTADDGAAEDRFGVSVSISGGTAIVGAWHHDDNGSDSGSAYVFKNTGSGWSQVAKLNASDGAESDQFGFSVSISGSTVIAGSIGDDDNGSLSGSACVFALSTNLDLQAASDTGVSDTDDITNDNTPTFDTIGSPYFRLYRNSSQISGDYESGCCTTAVQDDGTYDYAVTAVDVAGNESALGPAVTVTIDTTPPDVNLTVNVTSPTIDPTPNVTVTATDALSGLPHDAEVRLDVDLNNDLDFLDPGEAGYTLSSLTGGTATFDVTPALEVGVCNLRVRITDAAGNEGISATSELVVKTAPVANAGGPYDVAEGGTVVLDASASGSADALDTLTFEWDFDGDGQYDDAKGIQPDFSAVGLDGPTTVTVGLLVTDDEGGSDTDTAQIEVANVPSTADPGGPYEVAEGGTVVLNGSAIDPAGVLDTLSFEWDFDGDGQYDDASGATASFSATGLDGPTTVTVGLRVTDEDGGSDTDTAQIEVANVPPTADPGGPYEVAEGGSVVLNGSAIDPAGVPDTLSFEWDFDGDGQYDDASGATPSFSAAGLDGPTTVTVGLRVTDENGGSDTATIDVTVANALPTADAGGPYTTTEGKPVTLSGAASTDPVDTITRYEWDLDNDGTFETIGETTVYPAGLDGTFTIGLRVTDDDGASDWASVLVDVARVEPIDLGVVDFRELSGLDPAQGNAWYQMTIAHDGILTTIASSTSGTVEVGLYTARGESPLAVSTGNATYQRLDQSEVLKGETYLLKVSGTSNDAALTIANLVNAKATEVIVFGTDGADEFEFAASSFYAVTINGVEYVFDDAQYETIVFTGGMGGDTATLTGGPGDEAGRFFPDHGTFGENGFLVTVEDVTAITAHGGGGLDAALMYDSLGDDEFIVRKGYGKLSGEGFVLETFDFMTNYGYATTRDGGTDIAYMEDTSGNDKFKFDWPNPGQFSGKMYGGGIYYNRAKYFEQIIASMTDGKDTVRLFGSDGDEVLYGQKAQSRLTGDGFDVTVTGYNSLIAYASKGYDIAYLEDSDDDDTTRARPHKVMLWGGKAAMPTYEITARKFDEYHIECKHAGFDRAKLHDTVFDDYVHVEGDSASLYVDDGDLDLLYEVVAFDWVKLYATDNGCHDKIKKDHPLDFELVFHDPLLWEELP